MFKIISLKKGLENVAGFSFDGLSAGFKKDGQNDLGFIKAHQNASLWARFTRNKFKAAPIRHFEKTFNLNLDSIQNTSQKNADFYKNELHTNFILLNSKNANAMTGKAGIDDIDEIFKALKSLPNFNNFTLVNPLMSSTGVIGYRLNKEQIICVARNFNLNAQNSDALARAIMTTDRFKKEIALKVELEDGTSFNIACICKGAGMINPALATMLCFILTDAPIPNEDAHELLECAIEQSFNAISVDGDTSTNDTIMLLSSKQAKGYDREAFGFALNQICLQMALNLVKDGEGSTKVVAFEIQNAATKEEAKKAALALANSLLVKTALFGCDPNWGRIASTIGASGINCDENKLSIYYDDVLVYNAQNPQLDEIREKAAHEIMLKDSYKIICDIGTGIACYKAYGCDLGHEYVSINADYRS